MAPRKNRTNVTSAEKERVTEPKIVPRKQEQLICANNMRKRAAELLTIAAQGTKAAFHEEADRIIEEFKPTLRTALEGAKERLETNVSRTYIMEGTELFKKFQQISGRYGVINVEVKKVMGKTYVSFEIIE